MKRIEQWVSSRLSPLLPRALDQVAFSIADQAFSVGGMFVANIVLARVASKSEYGLFALAYSILNFVGGLHNAAILEPYTVYGAGRYRDHNTQYRWLIWRSNAWVGVALTATMLLIWQSLSWRAPQLGSRSLLGLAVTSGIILTAALLRRMLYIERKARLAAKMSFFFFITLLILLWFLTRAGMLDGLSVFLAIALASVVGGAVIIREVPRKTSLASFLGAQPNHWSEYWKYARWVLGTAFVCQFTTQAYYWLVAGLLSLRDVAGLRALVILSVPADQVFSALTQLILPLMAARFASKQIDQLLSLWRTCLIAFVSIGVAFVVGVVLFGSPVMHWIYGGKFDDISPLLGTLALLPVLLGIGHTMNAALKAAEKPNMVLYAYLASGVTTFAVGTPLIMHFGLNGAVYGLLASGGAYALALGIGFLAHMPRPGIQQVDSCRTGVAAG